MQNYLQVPFATWKRTEMNCTLKKMTRKRLNYNHKHCVFIIWNTIQIYKVTFNSPDKINVEFYRDLLKVRKKYFNFWKLFSIEERSARDRNMVEPSGIRREILLPNQWRSREWWNCSRYRGHQEHEAEGYSQVLWKKQFSHLLHFSRGRIIFVKYCNTDKPPKAKNVSDNVIVIKVGFFNLGRNMVRKKYSLQNRTIHGLVAPHSPATLLHTFIWFTGKPC